MPLVFYDTETTGTQTFFDQILQFAAIKTDEYLTELDRFQVRSRLLPHVVPSPEAMMITGLRVSELTDPRVPSHYEMVRAIVAKLEAWSPALFLGWNSIAFDENLLRQAFYKTLHNPYLTSRVGNSRSDAMRMVQACSVFAPDALVFPAGENGQRVFRLAHVAPANGYQNGEAHDAMADAEATVHLCRLVMERAPAVWSSFMRFSKKATVVDYISEERVFCLTDFTYSKPYSCLVTTLGQNQKNIAEWFVYDLSVDPAVLEELGDEALAARLAELPWPVRRLKANAAPILFPVDEAPPCCAGLELGADEIEGRADWLHNHPELCQWLVGVSEALRDDFPPSPHVEKQIYDRFFDKSDEDLMDSFHGAKWEQRPGIVERFRDPRLRNIGGQLLHLERPQLLGMAARREHEVIGAKRLLGQCEDVSWITLPLAISQVGEMMHEARGMKLERLRELDVFLRDLHDRAVAGANCAD